jgi:hypothetical protein
LAWAVSCLLIILLGVGWGSVGSRDERGREERELQSASVQSNGASIPLKMRALVSKFLGSAKSAKKPHVLSEPCGSSNNTQYSTEQFDSNAT